MKFVVYFDTPTPRTGVSTRTYLQEPGSLGYKFDRFATWENWDESQQRHTAQLASLDSRTLQLDTQAQAEELARNFGEAYTRYPGIYSVGYHGLTENGNACKPFRTVIKGNDNISQNLKARFEDFNKLNEAFESFLMPKLISRNDVTVGRECDFTKEELLGEMRYLLENMVEEEETLVMGSLHSMFSMNFRCTGWDKYVESMCVHFTRDAQNGNEKPFHTSLTITALNLWDEKGIQSLVDLAARRAAAGEVEHA